MTNPFDPPRKQAFDDAELALAIESAKDALAAMDLLEQQAKLRAEDAQAYVAWVRQMESLGTDEAKTALSAARRTQAGLPAKTEEEVSEVRDDSSWQKLVPDWQERQEAQIRETENAVARAKVEAEARLASEREAAVAAAIAEAEAEAERVKEEAVERVRAEAAEKLAAERAAAEEAARIEAERIAEQERIDTERIAAEREAARIEAERLAAEEAALIEAERLAAEEAQRVEAERIEAERLAAEEATRIEAERVAAEREAAEETARLEAERLEAERVAEAARVEVEPEPVAAADYATGSFDIIDSAEQSADDEEKEGFDFLLKDGELPFAREPKSGAIDQPLSTIARRSKPISQLFVWGGLNVGVAPLMLAAYVSRLPNAGDGILAIAVGLLFSSLLISVAAIAGKRSGLSTLILARAAFGVHGNLVSAIPLVLIKLVFGASLLYLGVQSFDGLVVGLPGLDTPALASAPLITLQAVGLVAVLLVGGVLAFFGGKTLYWAQLLVGGFGAIAVILFIAVTAENVSLDVLTFSATPDFFALVAVSSVVGIFFGAFWITSVAEFTRKIPMRESGTKVSLFVALATGVIPLLVSSYALIAFKSILPQGRIDAIESVLDEVLKVTPEWAANVLLYSAILTLVVWAASWMYATSVSFASINLKLRPAISQPILFAITIASAVFVSQFVNLSFAAVIIFAWAGIFVGDVAIRKIAYHEVSLARDYGFYRAWNWVNISGFLVAVATGLGLVSNVEGIWSWTGYISDSYFNVGIYIAPLVSFLFPILFGRKRIKLQEQEVLKIESRRHDLINVEAE
jgi:purine-cytosine permease-like protein